MEENNNIQENKQELNEVNKNPEVVNVQNNNPQEVSSICLIFGIIALFAWIIPLTGYPISILSIIFGSKDFKKNKKYSLLAIILGVISLILSLINSILGVMLELNIISY